MAKHDDEWEDVPLPADHESNWEDVPLSEADGEAEATRQATEKYNAEKPGYMDSFRHGVLQGTTRDWAAEGISRLKNGSDQKGYQDEKRQIDQKISQAQNENPKMFGLGDFVGMLGTSPVTKTPMGAMAVGGAEGVAKSLGGAEKIDPGSLARAGVSGTADALTAGAFSKYGPKILDAIKSTTKPVADYFEGVAGRQAVKSLGPNLGQTKTLQKRGVAEKVGNYALDTGIVNSWRTNAGMQNKAKDVLKQISEESRPVYEAAKDQSISSDDLLKLIGKNQQKLMAESGQVPVAEKLGKYAQQVEKGAEAGRTSYNPGDIAKFRRQVSKGLKPGSNENNHLAADEARRILREEEMRMIGAKDPTKRVENEDLFRRKNMSMLLEPIAERGAARSDTNNAIGLRTSGFGAVAGATAAAMSGNPSMSVPVGAGVGLASEILRRYGNQWGAVTAKKIANIANTNAYRPLFEAAFAKGGSAIPVLHQQLMKDDPDYAAQIEEGDNQSRVLHAKDLP